MRYVTLLFIYLNLSFNLFSQNLTGRVNNTQGEPLAGAIVAIEEINRDLICNENGFFQIELPKGEYTLNVKYITHESPTQKLSVTDSTQAISEIVLSTKQPTYLVVENKENPAYKIIHNALEKAPSYSNRLKSYTAELYVKETINLAKIPKILAQAIKEGKDLEVSELVGKTYIKESVNDINYMAPNRYMQTIKAISSSVPNNTQLNEVFEYLNGEIYDPNYNRFISPLDKNTFKYYKFKHEGIYTQDGQRIHKIKVIPKYNDSMLASGYIYIENDSWQLVSSNLTTVFLGLTQNLIINYQKVCNQTYLPFTYISQTKLDFWGTSAKLNLFATTKFQNIIATDSSNTIKANKTKEKQNYMIHNDSSHNIKIDSLAYKQNSTYWENIRGVQMDSMELNGFKDRDSIQNKINSHHKKLKKNKTSLESVMLGGKILKDTSFVSFKYNGIFSTIPEYNYVDGFWLGQKFEIEKKMKSSVYTIKVSPYMYYTTARQQIIGGIDFKMNYSPMMLGELIVSTGSTSADFNSKNIERFDNAVSSLLFGSNQSYYYQKDYISVQNNIDIANGLRLGIDLEIANRHGLPNNTKYSILGNGNKIRPNMKNGERFDKASYGVNLTYAPQAYYSIKNGIKKYEYYTSPTFTFSFEQGVKNEMQKNSSVYNKISIGIKQSIRLGHFSDMHYSFNSGTFLWSVKNTDFTDFYHFRSSNAFSTSKMPYDSYLLLNSYKLSTNNHWMDAQINYRSKYIFLKRLPFLQGKPFDECIHLKSLYTPEGGMYNELGYSLNVSRFLNLGAYTSFEKLKYHRFAVRLSWIIPFLKL